jgi:hypothetical protein
MRKVIFFNIGAALRHQILSERAERPKGNSPQTESGTWQWSNEANASLLVSVGSSVRV